MDIMEVVQLQKAYNALKNSGKLSKAALVDLVAPYRDKYGFSDADALNVARSALSLEQLVELYSNVKQAGRKAVTHNLSEMLEEYIAPHNDKRIYWAKEVTFDYGTQHQVRVDYMRFKPRSNTISGIESGDFYCYEVKSSVADFESKHGHNFLGDYNYYVMPLEVYKAVKDKIRHNVGVLCYDKTQPHLGLYSVKKAKRMDRSKSLAEMLLMMFRSARRDV